MTGVFRERKYLKQTLHILSVLAVILVAGALRLYAVRNLPTDYDEDDYLRAAQEFTTLIRTGNLADLTETNYRPEHPAFNKILFGFALLTELDFPLIPDRPTTAQPDQYLPIEPLHAARSVSALSGTLEAAALALVNPLAGLLLGIHSYNVKYTSQVMLEGLPALTSLLSVLAYNRWKKTDKEKKKWLLFSALFLGLTAASKYLYALVGFAILFDWIWDMGADARKRIRAWIPLLVWGLLSLFFFYLADPYLWLDPLGRISESLFYHSAYSSGASEVSSAGYPVWQPFVWLSMSIPWHPDVLLITLDGFITIFALIGFKKLWEEERVYGIWIIVMIVFLLIWKTKWPQYILALTAPLALAAAKGIGLSLRSLVRSTLRAKSDASPVNWREMLQAFPWLLPGMVAFIALILYPLFFQIVIALTDMNGGSLSAGMNGEVWSLAWQGLTGKIEAIEFNPLQNFRYFNLTLHYVGTQMLRSVFGGLSVSLLVFEIIWVALSVGMQALLGISLALMLARPNIRYPNFWRTIFILPWAVPEFIGALVWLRTLNPTFGWVSMMPYSTSSGSDISLFGLLLASTWYGFPFIMLAASASLKMMPKSVYEAAALDGASGLALFREVTFPLLLPLVIPAIIIRGIFAFNQFYLFYVMQTDFPIATFASVSYFFMTQANQYAFSAAINIFTVLALIVLLIWFNHISRAAEGVDYA
jgi:arabinogalactan oligomer/maltooligosaccharide transport system permease protein